MAKTMTGQSRVLAIAGDTYRGSFVVWDRLGRLPPRPNGWYGQPTYTLVAPDGTSKPIVRTDPGKQARDIREWDATYHGEVVIPAGLKPGDYVLNAGELAFSIKLDTLPVRKGTFTVLNPRVSIDVVRKLLASGYDLWLNPGVYEWARNVFNPNLPPLTLPTGCKVYGPGAIITPDPKVLVTPGQEWEHSAFVGGAWAVLDGLTFDLTPGMRVVQGTTAPYLTMVRCRINADVNDPGPGMVLQDSSVRGAVWTATGCMVRRTKFTDRPFSCWAANGSVALIDTLFDGTDRGPFFQPNWGDVRASLFLGVTVNNVDWSENGCECFLCEHHDTNGFHDNLILHYRYRSSAGGGTAIQWDDKATGNLVREAKIAGGWGLNLAGAGCTGNEVRDSELRDGARITLGAGTTGNTFADTAIVNPAGGAWNEHWIAQAWIDDVAAVTWNAEPPGENTFERVYFRLPEGYRVMKSAAPLKFTDCTHNGEAYAGTNAK